MTDRESKFRRQLRQFRVLTIVGYAMLLLVVVGMAAAQVVLPKTVGQVSATLPVAIVGVVLMLAVVMPFIWLAYEKTACPNCGKRIDDEYWFWRGVRINGPTRRYWKLFFGRPLQCPHCQAEVIAAARPEYAPYHGPTVSDGARHGSQGGALRASRKDG